MVRSPALALVLAVALVGAAACGPQRPAPVAPTGPPVAHRPSPAEVAGVWDWVFRSSDEQGDVRVEQEEWHLEQRGAALAGWYDRAVTTLSTDDRLYRCNQKLGFTKFTRVRLAGSIDGERFSLREVDYETHPGPCDDGARSLVRYVGTLSEAAPGSLKLEWAPGAGQTLHRREGKEARPPLAQLAGVSEGTLVRREPAGGLAAGMSGGASEAVTGTWDWELKSVDADGDQRMEREEWHLDENAEGITGFYDRRVSRAREGGTFACNRAERFDTATRYRVHGQRLGDRIALTEVDYQVEASPCDNGQRRLDTYQGSVSSDGGELILSWGPGNQLLKRRR